MASKKTLNIIAVVVLVSATVFIAVRRSKNKKEIAAINDRLDGKTADPNAVGQKIISATDLGGLPDGSYPIKIGDKNKKVYAIQQLLNKKFGSGIDLDGVYGDSTFKSLCTNLWSVGITHTKATSCYDFHLGSPTRRTITQADYTALNK